MHSPLYGLQWATLRPSTIAATEPALVLDIWAHGYAYRIRPLAQASRSQRIFYSLAKSFASLPKIPANMMPAGSLAAAAESSETLDADVKEEALRNGNVFEQLLEVGGREDGGEELVKATVLADEPEEMTADERRESPTRLPLPDAGTTATPENDRSEPIVAAPAKVRRQPRINTAPSKAASLSSAPSSPVTPASPRIRAQTGATARSRPSSIASSDPTSSRASSPTLGSKASSKTTAGKPTSHDTWPKPFTFEESDLPRLHETLQSRLMPFWGFKLGGRRVRLSVYPVLEPGSLWDRPLATKVVTTASGGAFRTMLEVKSKELRRLLHETGKGIDGLESLRIRVVSELLEEETLGEALTGGMLQHQALRTVTDDEVELAVAHDGGVRVISDIDDTIKWTQVLSGTKTIFRNVFVREVDEIKVRQGQHRRDSFSYTDTLSQVPGMVSWYQRMRDVGAHFHYVSNSPWELWPVIATFLREAGEQSLTSRRLSNSS